MRETDLCKVPRPQDYGSASTSATTHIAMIVSPYPKHFVPRAIWRWTPLLKQGNNFTTVWDDNKKCLVAFGLLATKPIYVIESPSESHPTCPLEHSK